jgi:hypothetical protein
VTSRICRLAGEAVVSQHVAGHLDDACNYAWMEFIRHQPDRDGSWVAFPSRPLGAADCAALQAVS